MQRWTERVKEAFRSPTEKDAQILASLFQLVRIQPTVSQAIKENGCPVLLRRVREMRHDN